jgi:hypothetical protein
LHDTIFGGGRFVVRRFFISLDSFKKKTTVSTLDIQFRQVYVELNQEFFFFFLENGATVDFFGKEVQPPGKWGK